MNNKSVKVYPPRGFAFQITENKYGTVIVFLLNKMTNRRVGSVRLVPDQRHRAYPLPSINLNTYRTHSYMQVKYQGKGYGTKIYARAIQWAFENGKKVKSSGCSSHKAQRVWEGNGIRRYFNVNKRWDRSLYGPVWTPSPKK